MDKLPEQKRYEALEQQYDELRLGVAAGVVPVQDLEELAAETLEAAQLLAIRRGWVLPEIKLLGQPK
jgi:hypothetical protein